MHRLSTLHDNIKCCVTQASRITTQELSGQCVKLAYVSRMAGLDTASAFHWLGSGPVSRVLFSSDRQHLSYDGFVEVKGEIMRIVLCCIVYNVFGGMLTHLLLCRTRRFLTSDGHDYRRYSFCLPKEGWPGWVGLGGWLNAKVIVTGGYMRHPTHISTYPAWDRVTLLIFS